MKHLQIAIIPGIIIISVLLFGLAELVFAQSGADTTQANYPLTLSTSEEHGNEIPQCSLSEKYPQSILNWCREIDKVSLSTGLDSNIIAAVMLQESGGNPAALSSSGAVGLLQVMPRDGKAAEFMCVNGPCFSSRPTIDELLDPEFNIQYGTNYLASLVFQTGNLREALMRYGPYNVGYYYADKVLAILASHDG